MNKGGSESESDSDSDSSEKEIVVRQLPARHVVRASPEQHRPGTKSPESEPMPAPASAPAPPIPINNTVYIGLSNPEQMTRSVSYDDDENVHTPGSARSVFSVREEDIVVIMRSIPEYGQYIDAKGLDNDRYLRSALYNISEDLLDYQDENGNTLLLIACQYSCEELVRILLQQGADARVTNTSGANGLHFACYRDSLSIPIVERLLAHHAQVNVAENLYGCTPLHYAAGTGNLALCELLIHHGAYIHAHDFDNCSSIDYAKDAGMFEVADYLTEELNAAYGTAKNTNKGAKHVDSQSNSASTTPARAKNTTDSIMQTKTSPMADMGSTSKATPAATPQRFVLNENSPSYDENDHISRHNDAYINDTRTQRTVYDFIEPASEQHSSLPPIDHHHANANNTSGTNTVFRASAKGSPGSAGSVSSSAQSSPGNATNGLANTNTNNNATTAQAAHTIKKGHQPTTASPYKPLSPSPVNASSTKNGAAKGFFIATDDLHDNMGGSNSGPNTITSSHTYSAPLSHPSSHSSSSGAHSRYSNGSDGKHSEKHSEIPPLPTPTYNSPDGHYSEVDNYTDLSPDKFELYIERAKFNAKIAKERALNKDILGAKEGQIRTLQAEVSALKRSIVSYKEEVHALKSKLDLMQLPFIETTNALQEELHALRAENKQLREQLSGKH